MREDLPQLIERAIAGDERPLFERLERGSRLPGTHANLELAEIFAASVASLGKRASALAIGMTTLHPDRAQGGTAHEFLPVCGVFAVGALAAASEGRARARLVAVLHDAAEDLRFRVRDAVPIALAKIGAKDDALVFAVQPWMDGYFHAAAVLRAMIVPEWLHAQHDGAVAAERLGEALALIAGSPRSAERWPGWKALTDAVALAAPALALRFGAPIFSALETHASNKDPAMRALVRRACEDAKLQGRFPEDLARVRKTLDQTEPKPRDPRAEARPTRRRGQR